MRIGKPKVDGKPLVRSSQQLNETYYHYCDIDNATVDAFEAADLMGRFFNTSIKGHFDCPTGHIPAR